MIVVSLRVVVINEAIDNVIIALTVRRISNKLFMYRCGGDVNAPMRLSIVLAVPIA